MEGSRRRGRWAEIGRSGWKGLGGVKESVVCLGSSRVEILERAILMAGLMYICVRSPLFCEQQQHTRLEQEQRVAKALLYAQHASELYKAVQDES